MQWAHYMSVKSGTDSESALSTVHLSPAWSGSSSTNAVDIYGFSCCRIPCEHITKTVAQSPLCLSSHFIFYLCHTLCCKTSYLQIDNRDGVIPNSKHPKTALYWIFAFSPYVLMKKETLSFLIPWQLFRQWDHIILTQFWPISPASWFFILPSYTPFPTLNRPFLSQRENPFLLYSHQKTT